MRQSIPDQNRRGVATVEFALVLPVFFLVIFSAIELGNMSMVRSVLINQSREAVRLAINSNSEEALVTTSALDSITKILRVDPGKVTINVMSVREGQPVEKFEDTERGDHITVTVSVPYSEVGIVAGKFVDHELSSSCTMVKE